MTTSSTISYLGKDESKHIKCEYEGHEGDCPQSCSNCAISIKTDGDLALMMDACETAIDYYLKALRKNPKFAEAWCNLGNAYGMLENYEQSLQAFNKAIKIDPKYGKALFGKAITLSHLEYYSDALVITDVILHLYKDASVEKFRENLIMNHAIDFINTIGMDQDH